MLIWIIAATVLVPGQTPDPFYGSVPKNVQTFRVIERGESRGYAALELDGRWISEISEITPAKRPRIVFDTPWAPNTETARYGRMKYEPTADALRVERLRQGWKEAGYEFIALENGAEIPVLSEDLARAERAREMELASRPRELSSATAAPEEVEATPKPGFLSLWGPHIVTAAIGLLLLGLVGKTMIFSDSATWDKVG